MDNCNACGQDHIFDLRTDVIVVILTEPQLNHIRTICPNCEYATRIYISPLDIQFLNHQSYRTLCYAVGNDELRNGYDRAVMVAVPDEVRNLEAQWHVGGEDGTVADPSAD